MNRRNFLKAAGAHAGALAISGPDMLSATDRSQAPAILPCPDEIFSIDIQEDLPRHRQKSHSGKTVLMNVPIRRSAPVLRPVGERNESREQAIVKKRPAVNRS